VRREESSSFLKKRTKKLLLFWRALPGRRATACKSFLLLFFKKEALAFLLLAGCASPPLTLYTLSDEAGPGPAAPSLGAHPFVIEVARVTIPDDLDSEDIVLQDGSMLRRSKTGRWASRLSLEITSMLAQRLAARHPEALVTDVRQLTPPSERLLVSITRLDLAVNGAAEITADWQIVPEDGRGDIMRDRAQFSLSGPVANDHDVVALEQQLIGKLTNAISLPPAR
jgi:uncharacterized lipoprotein YmbA